MNICLISSYTSQLLKNSLNEKLLSGNINATISISEYNIIHDIISDNSLIYQSHFDFVILLFLLNDIKQIDEFINCLRTCRNKLKCTLLISNFISPVSLNLYECNQGDDKFDDFIRFQSTLKHFILSEKPANTYLLDFNSLATNIGHSHFFDSRLWHAFKIPFSQKGMEAVSQLINRAVQCLTHPRKKCIVLDCDNTLWGGIIGEDGIEGIKLGPTYPGNCYLSFQQQLLELKKIGFILSINSKNNENDVLEVLNHHPWQVLKQSDFVRLKINWENKVDNFINLSKELNLGMDSFIFFDDNPAEIQIVKDRLPEITARNVPKDNPIKIASLIEDSIEIFDLLKITEEDKAKTEIYLADICRQQLIKSSSSIDDYYKSLDMTIEIRKNSKLDIPRLSQMTLKTNQFNLMTIRRNEDEIIKLLDSKNYIIYCFKLIDKFGDNGIVGYCEVRKEANRSEIINFLMSCRVIGRTAENEFLTQILRDLESQGISSVSATWSRSPKNSICDKFLDNFGFINIESNVEKKTYQLDLNNIELSSLDYYKVVWQQEMK